MHILPDRNRTSRRALVAISITLIMALLLPQVMPVPSRAMVETRPMGNHSTRAASSEAPLPPAAGSGDAGLTIVLSEGAEQPAAAEPLPLAEVTPLSPDEIQAIVDRMPPLPQEEGDVQEFRLPAQTLPPPRTGATVQETFPAAETGAEPPVVDSGPLAVLRYAPEGPIPLAPFLNVTFSQPMVPLATLDALAAEDVPVKLTPAIPGLWRWIGTTTLTFEYQSEEADRFPMATEYVAEVPAGTTSATGGVLAEAVRWTFTTPAPVLRYTHPGFGPQSRTPLLFASFNQRIQPAAVLETASVTAGGQAFPVRLATPEEVAADASVRRLAEMSGESRWLAFRTLDELPPDTTVVVNFGPGTPSAEGPLTTAEVQSFSFTTYGALRITDHRCGYGGECPPYSTLSIVFSNPLDPDLFSEELITVEPEIPGLIVENYGNTIGVRGSLAGRTAYQVTVSGELRDIFGQTLGQDQTVTFQIGSGPRVLTGPQKSFVTLDPTSTTPVFTIYSMNYGQLRVRAYAVSPADWQAYQAYQQEYWRTTTPPDPPGVLKLSETIRIDGEPDQLVETSIDLSAALAGETGHLIVVVDLPPNLLLDWLGRDRPVVHAWVQVTQIGLDAFSDQSHLIAWATRLADGAPLAGVEMQLEGAGAATAGEDGIATFDLPTSPSPTLVASLGDDVAMLPYADYYWSDIGWQAQPITDELRWYVFDDRAMYRPGEEVHVKGWIRRIGGGPTGDVSLPPPGSAVAYTVIDPQGNPIGDGVADLNDLSGFDLAFTLPEGANLGYATLMLSFRGSSLPGESFYHSFQIQEFRRPEFEVTAQMEGKGPWFVGDEAIASVSAQYFAGGSLPNAETTWSVTSSPGSYSPPNWPDFTFGKWQPWWFYGYGEIQPAYGYASDVYGYGPYGAGPSAQTYSGRTDAAGLHYLKMDFVSAQEPRPYSVLAEAMVMDVNRQAWAATTSLLVHPAAYYVGIRSGNYFVEQGQPLVIDAIVTDLDGKPVVDREVTMRSVRLEWKYSRGQWREEEVDEQTCTVASAAEPVSCTFETALGGEYRITAQVKDELGRANESSFTRWVSGGQQPPARNVEREQVTLIPNQESYQPGDVAEVLVQPPFTPAEGLLTVSRSGILYTERFRIDEGTFTLKIPVEDAHIPNLNVQVDLTGASPRTDDNGEPLAGVPPRPAFASGQLSLPIPPLSRTLAVTLAPAASELEPGAETTLDLTVVNAAGQPVANAELAVVVVDEAILALTNYQLADPVATFYTDRWSGVESRYGRDSIMLADPAALVEQVAGASTMVMESMAMPRATMAIPLAAPAAADMAMAAEMPAMAEAAGMGGMDKAAQPAITVRSDFNPLATFAPAVRTDAAGRATVAIKLPDNLTRYRIMAVAVADGKFFGSAESNVVARLPLMLRPSAPRFLNFGDRFELPLVVQNQTDQPMDVDVVVQATNLELTAGEGFRFNVPANDRREVRFPAATVNAGTTRLQMAAASGAFADAAQAELPVYTPATTEAFATYGVVDAGAVVQPVATPSGVFPQFGGLEISTSSTALQALTDAVLYLQVYPFECSEQIASRVMSVAALRDVLTAFQAEGLPSPEEMERAMRRDIERLQAMQNDDGGWPVWTRGKPSVPFYSIHVAHALQRARMKDYAVSDETLQQAVSHLRAIESYYPHWYGQYTRRSLSAYALYVRQLMGDVDTAKARSLLDEAGLDGLSLEGLAWIWQVLSDDPASAQQVEEIRTYINNRAVETPSAANFVTSYGDEAFVMLHSDRRTDGIILDALIQDDPENTLIPKVVNGLLAHQTQGHWANTQENVFILLALDRYFNTFESVTPDFVARVWLGDTTVAEHEFRGRTTDTRQTTVPMSYLMDPAQGAGDTQDLTLAKDGDGRLYYRLGLRYAPDDLTLEPLDMGFVVQRLYEAVDDPDDVWRDGDGVWHIKAGARVRVRLTMVTSTRRYHVALADPLPAGLEIINPALAVSESVPQDPNQRSGAGWWWWGTWYDHQNMRDQRAEAFTTLLWEGVYDYSYVARATTPGQFVVPPAKAEEMYTPEVFGRSGSDKVIVE